MDWQEAVALYAQLNTQAGAVVTEVPQQQFATVLAHPGTAVFGAFIGGALRAMVTVHLLPNMTYGGRPYAVIENVVTDEAHRGTGLGRDAMQAAIDHASREGAYKVMLLTGAANAATGFYEKLGFRADEKIGMILRLP